MGERNWAAGARAGFGTKAGSTLSLLGGLFLGVEVEVVEDAVEDGGQDDAHRGEEDRAAEQGMGEEVQEDVRGRSDPR